MGAASSTQQNNTSYNKLTNTININATNKFLNNAVMESMKKSIISLNQNCTQKFESNAIIQLSNLTSAGNVSITDLNLNSNNVVKFDCVVQSQMLSQTENNFISDNSASMASMLQSIGTSDFMQSVSGSLKSTIDSTPLTFSNTSSNQSNTNIIDTQTSQNIVQDIQNLYKSTSVDDTTMQNVNEAYQGFVNNAKIIVNNVTAGGNIQVAAIRLDTLNQLDATAKLAGAISQVILQKMQSILGMKIEFQSDTAQQSTATNTSTTNTSNTTTLSSLVSIPNNAINAISNLFNIPTTIAIYILIGIVVLVVAIIIYKFLSKPKSFNNFIKNNTNNRMSFIENDTMSTSMMI